MNRKKVFDDVDNKLYANFALKKAERKEEIIKMKEKLFKKRLYIIKKIFWNMHIYIFKNKKWKIKKLYL